MGVFRTYFSKDNTIIKNKYVNTGLNPVTELFYGTPEKLYSRYLFDFDITKIKNLIEDYSIPENNIKHSLKLTNTLAYEKFVTYKNEHATSFDLVLFKIPEFWDEGIGYDFQYDNEILDLNNTIRSTPSNWYNKTTLSGWSEYGVYSGTTSDNYNVVDTIHFDIGDENIDLDITDLITELIISGTSNFYGLGLAFTSDYENMDGVNLTRVAFYGRATHTFFEPFIETTWIENIKDDRNDFQYNKSNKLYLYTNINKSPVNLDESPQSVIIKDYNDEIVLTLTAVTHEGKGVYSVNFELESNDYDNITLVNFTDIWSGLTLNSKSLPDVKMEFTVKENNYFNIGNEVYEPEELIVNFTGIKKGEKIPKGEKRKIIVTAKELYGYDKINIDSIYYHIYVKQGNTKITVIPETNINMAFNQNYFYLDTSWMISQDYNLEIIVHSNDTITRKDDIYFTIIDNITDNLIF